MKHKRFTKKDKRGFYYYNCTKEEQEDCSLMENCGECYGTRVLYRLGELEDKIEQGTVIELPCKVGDTVYVILNWDKGEKSIEDGIVTEIECAVSDNGLHCRIYVDHDYIFSGDTKLVKQRYIFFQNEVFLTREEAEKRLKELQNG